MTQPLLGKTVQYHGSCETAHGLYTVTHVPYDPDGRGYSVHKNGENRNDPEAYLHNVHRDSFTLKPEDRYEAAQYSPFTPNEYGIWDHANKDWAGDDTNHTYRCNGKPYADGIARQLNKDYPW
jgi:hypothetical protein